HSCSYRYCETVVTASGIAGLLQLSPKQTAMSDTGSLHHAANKEIEGQPFDRWSHYRADVGGWAGNVRPGCGSRQADGPESPVFCTGPRSRYGVLSRVLSAQFAISSLRANQTLGLLFA